MGDDPFAKAHGLSPRKGGQTMVELLCMGTPPGLYMPVLNKLVYKVMPLSGYPSFIGHEPFLVLATTQ